MSSIGAFLGLDYDLQEALREEIIKFFVRERLVKKVEVMATTHQLANAIS